MLQTRPLVLSLIVAAAGPAAAQQVASVQLSHASLNLSVGARQTVFATAYSASGAPVAAQFRWASSDEAVVAVEVSASETDFAEIIGIGPGTARVTVRAGSRSEALTVTVTGAGAAPAVAGTGPAAALNIDPTTIQLLRGETRQLRPVFLRADGEPASASPVAWTSLTPGVANVDATSGIVVGISAGQGAVQATAGSLSKIATVEVEDAPFAFTVPVLGLSPDAEATLGVIVPSQRSRMLDNGSLTWRSTNEQIVRVTPLGMARAVGPGRATLVVEGFGQVRELPVTVHRPVAFADATPAFSRGPIQVPLNGARAFQVVSKAADETTIPEAPIVWSVGDTSVAVFDTTAGELTGRRLGTTTLTARPAGPGLDITWQIEVIAGGIRVAPDRVAFSVGETRALAADFTTVDGAPLGPAQAVQWTTLNVNVVQVTASGRLSAVTNGRAQVIAATQWGSADTVEVFVSGPLLYTSAHGGSADLYAMDPLTPGAEPVQVTGEPSNEAMGAWSPDGSRVAFISDRDGNYELYVADADGGAARRLTSTTDVTEVAPAWTPDGREIVYGTQVTGGRLQIRIIGADGTGARALTTDDQGVNLEPAVSPDGRTIAFTTTREGTYDVFMMDRDGSNQRAAVRTPAKESRPKWFPNGDLGFVQERSDRGRPVPVVVRQPAGGGVPQALSPMELPVTDFAVSADGNLLVVEVTTPTADGRSERRFYALPVGGAPTELPRAAGEQPSSPSMRRGEAR